jgi:hypothetical protein
VVDALDHPALTAALRSSGLTTSEAHLVKDMARHAVDQALLGLLRVLETVDDDTVTSATLAAFVLLREKANDHAMQLGAAIAKKHGLPWPPPAR